jgi:hypothetical protein
MTTNQPRSVEERVYLRWSNDWFITSHIIEASPGGDGLTYTATRRSRMATPASTLLLLPALILPDTLAPESSMT